MSEENALAGFKAVSINDAAESRHLPADGLEITKAHTVKTINSHSFGQIRYVMVGKNRWYIGMDITRILGYKTHNYALKRYVDDGDRLWLNISTEYGVQEVISISTNGVLTLLEKASYRHKGDFKKWFERISKNCDNSEPNNESDAIQRLVDATNSLTTIVNERFDRIEKLLEELNGRRSEP